MIERAKTMIEKAKQTWYWTVGSIGAVLVTTVIVPEGSRSGDLIVWALGFGEVETGDVDNGYDAVVIVGHDAS